MLNVRLAGDHLYVFVLSFFPRDVLDEKWDLIRSVSAVVPTFF